MNMVIDNLIKMILTNEFQRSTTWDGWEQKHDMMEYHTYELLLKHLNQRESTYDGPTFVSTRRPHILA